MREDAQPGCALDFRGGAYATRAVFLDECRPLRVVHQLEHLDPTELVAGYARFPEQLLGLCPPGDDAVGDLEMVLREPCFDVPPAYELDELGLCQVDWVKEVVLQFADGEFPDEAATARIL